MAEIVTSTEDQTLESVQYRVELNPAATRQAGRPIYTGRVALKETYSTRDVAERMVAEGCAVKSSTVRLVLTEFAELVGKLTREGRAVNIGGVVRFAPAVRGTFASEDAAWDASKNAVVVNASVGSRMRVAAVNSNVQRVESVVAPTLTRLVDGASMQENTITSEGSFFVLGTRLTWDATKEDEGFFLAFEGAETRCTALESKQDPTCATLKTSQVFTSAGEPVELFFRTRAGTSTLRQYAYGQDIVTALPANA